CARTADTVINTLSLHDALPIYQDKTTPFEMAWDQLGRSLKNNSWHQDEEGNIIWEALARADTLSGIGHYGVILLGIDDGKELYRSEEHTSELQSRENLVCRLLL